MQVPASACKFKEIEPPSHLISFHVRIMVYEYGSFIEVDVWIDQENKAKEGSLALQERTPNHSTIGPAPLEIEPNMN